MCSGGKTACRRRDPDRNGGCGSQLGRSVDSQPCVSPGRPRPSWPAGRGRQRSTWSANSRGVDATMANPRSAASLHPLPFQTDIPTLGQLSSPNSRQTVHRHIRREVHEQRAGLRLGRFQQRKESEQYRSCVPTRCSSISKQARICQIKAQSGIEARGTLARICGKVLRTMILYTPSPRGCCDISCIRADTWRSSDIKFTSSRAPGVETSGVVAMV